jgi:hypothetical protein
MANRKIQATFTSSTALALSTAFSAPTIASQIPFLLELQSDIRESVFDLFKKRSGAQAGIRTRVLRATAAYTGPNYTTWAQTRRNNTHYFS